MLTSSITQKGQVTIPAAFRKALDLHIGDKVTFNLQDGQVVIAKKMNDIKSAFGLHKSKHSVSLSQMDKIIKERGSHASS